MLTKSKWHLILRAMFPPRSAAQELHASAETRPSGEVDLSDRTGKRGSQNEGFLVGDAFWPVPPLRHITLILFALYCYGVQAKHDSLNR